MGDIDGGLSNTEVFPRMIAKQLTQRMSLLASQQSDGWTPLELGSYLEGWWRADSLVTYDGSGVSAWGDLSGHGRTFSQPVVANRPAYVPTGGHGNGPYLSSALIANAGMDITGGAPASTILNDYSLLIVCAQLAAPVNNVYFTSLLAPAGTSLFRFRRNLGGDMGVDQPTTSAPTIVQLPAPDMNPIVPPTWLAFCGSVSPSRERTCIGWGSGIEGIISDGVHANIGVSMGEGRIFQNNAGVTTPQIGISEVVMVRKQAATPQLLLWRSYFRSRGVNT